MSVTQFRGDSNIYRSVAKRGNQVIGLSVSYVTHLKYGCIAIRFVAFGETAVTPFTHFVVREDAAFKNMEDGDAVFVGVRLNKVLIPVFTPSPSSAERATYLEKFCVCQKIAEWVLQQLDAEGFEVTADVLNCVKVQLGGDAASNNVAEVNHPYPDLLEQKKQWMEYLAAKGLKKKVDDENDEDDEEEEEPVKKFKVN